MEAIQKGLDQVTRRAPGLHSTSSSAKAALTNPTVHDSINRLIQQIETAKAAVIEQCGADQAVVLAELKSATQIAQKGIIERQKEFYGAISKVSKAIDKKFPTPVDGVTDPSLFTSPTAQKALETVILKHLLRNGDWQSAQVFAQEASLPISSHMTSAYGELHLILESINKGELQPAIKWAQLHRPFLNARQSPLEFVLHRSQFIRIAAGLNLSFTDSGSPTLPSPTLAASDPDGENIDMMEDSVGHLNPPSSTNADSLSPPTSSTATTNVTRALNYGRRFFQPFTTSHLSEIQRLFTLLAFLPAFVPESSYGPDGLDMVPTQDLLTTVPIPYRPLLDANLVHAPFLEPLFRVEYCTMNQMAKEAPLSICVEIGAGEALNRIIKVKTVMRDSGNEWSQADELPIEIPLPSRLRYHSIFACPVSKEQATKDNPPMMLACGHVLCLDTLNRMAKGSGRFKCSYCPTESSLSQAIRVYF